MLPKQTRQDHNLWFKLIALNPKAKISLSTSKTDPTKCNTLAEHFYVFFCPKYTQYVVWFIYFFIYLIFTTNKQWHHCSPVLQVPGRFSGFMTGIIPDLEEPSFFTGPARDFAGFICCVMIAVITSFSPWVTAVILTQQASVLTWSALNRGGLALKASHRLHIFMSPYSRSAVFVQEPILLSSASHSSVIST